MKYFPSLFILFALIFSLKAQGQNPIFTTNPIVTVNQGQEYFYPIKAVDPEGGAISYSASLPSWLSLGASENAVVTTFAGSFISGFQEGVGANGTFNNPAGAVVDVDGNIYVADRFNHRIRKIATDGVVTTFAGAGRAGFKDGIGEQAFLNSPSDLVIDDNGDILFVDGGNYVIRKISSNGSVTTILGSGIKGFKDGTGTEVEFGFLSSIDIDSQGNLYALDGDNEAVRKITPEGVVTTFVDDSDTGSPGNPNFSSLSGLAIDGDDNVFIGDYIGRIVRKITPEGVISVIAGSGRRESVDGQGVDASFTLINQLEVDEQGNVLVADDNLVRVISPEGNVTTIRIGETPVGNENLGTFNVYGIALDSEGNIITTSTFRGKILKTFINGTTTLIAGGEQVPYIDDLRLTSTFNALQSISSDQEGNVFITESNSSTIRKISVDGRVTTIAGSSQSGYQEGTATQAKFSTSLRITASIDGNIYIADQGNYVIRKIDQNGLVTTLAGSGSYGHADGQGTLSSFKGLGDIATDNEGNIYVTDEFRVRKITPQGLVSTLAGSDTFGFANGMGSQAQFRQISGIDVDSEGNVYVVDNGNFRVRKISSDGNVSTYAGSGTQKSEDGTGTGASFYFPYSIAIGDNGKIYVSDNFQLRVIEQDLSVSTIAGSTTNGANDGIGLDASFSLSLIDMDVDPYGNVLVADYFNYLVRKVLFSSPVLEGNAGNNVGIHNVSITATDENVNETVQSFQIEVIDTEDPVFTSATTANFAENGTGIAYTITATDASPLTYSLGTENDEALFNVDVNTGEVTFKVSPDFEAPTDANEDNEYVIEVKASDAVNIVNQTVTITLIDVNDNKPVITSNGGGPSANINLNENSIIVTTVAATDADAITQFFNFIAPSGADEALFKIDLASGILSFKNGAPDFENPLDSNKDNIYEIVILAIDGPQATQGTFATAQSLKITITDVDETDPVITSSTAISFDENGTGTAYTITATDANAITYSLGTGNDEAFFNIAAGVVTFKTAPDFETKSSYSIEVKANDGLNTASQNVTITITDVDEILPVFTSTTTANFAENGTGIAYTITATDASPLTYSLGTENDEALFNVDATTGEVTFKVSPDFEAPTDVNADNIYLIKTIASDDSGNSADQIVSITILNDNGELPIFSSEPITSINENQLYQYQVVATNPQEGSVRLTLEQAPNWLKFDLMGKVASVDGVGSELTMDDQGNIYVIDGNQIKKIDASGSVSLLAGREEIGSEDGIGSNASFFVPVDITFGPDGNLYVADSRNGLIRRVTLSGEVTTFAGYRNNTGFSAPIDGFRLNAKFAWPSDMVFDSEGNMFVADSRNRLIRKINTLGEVSTFAGNLEFVYLNRGNGPEIVDTKGGFQDGVGTEARFSLPEKISIDKNDNLYVVDRNNDRICKITPDGRVTTIAGSTRGYKDGIASVALFNNPKSIAVDDQNRIYVGEDRRIRVISENYIVTTIAGSEEGGLIDGIGQEARINAVSDIFIDSNGELIFNDFFNGKRRRLTVENDNVLSGFSGNEVGTYSVVIKAASSEGEASQLYTLKVNDVTPPQITSSANINFVENVTGTAYTISATDASPLTYSLGTENDEALFNVDATTGEVTFKVSPDFETPADANADNDYVIEVKASDAVNIVNQTVTITLIDVNDNKPVITSNGGGPSANINLNENSIIVTTVTATDADAITQFFNFIAPSGADEALFKIDLASGILSFKNGAPDFENPLDSNKDNIYEIVILAIDGPQATQGTFATAQSLKITITDVDETDPVITSSTAISFDENGTGTAYTITATDENAITYSLGTGNDEALFNIAAGVVTFKTAPDFETKNSYAIQVRANDALNTASQIVTITITDVDEIDPVFTSATAISFAENGTGTAYTITSTDANPITYSLGTGNDEALFNIAAGVVTFKTAPDFETKNSYAIQVRANDGLNTASQNVTITITDVDEIDPVFTSTNIVTFAENETGTAYTITATDVNPITYSLGTGNDEALFNIAAGVVTFKTAPDFEIKSSYTIQVKASDGLNTSTQNVTINITDIDELLPVFTSSTSVNFAENGTGTAYTIAATDANPITYSLGTSNDESLFELNNNLVKFKVSPDFETPIDANKDNAYAIEVIASDALNVKKQIVTIMVMDIDEIKPTVVLTTDASATVFSPSIQVKVKFSETVNGLEAADFDAVNATISEFKGQGDSYSFQLTSVSDGEISVKLKANAVVDRASNNNEVSAVLSRIVEARNESPTEISLDVSSINENIAARTLIGLLSAKDVDVNDSHQFNLVNGAGSTNNANFDIIGNKLFKKADVSFDFETAKAQSIRIKTIDVRGGDFEAVISIAVLNVAEPSFAISVVNPSDFETSNNALSHGRVKVGVSKIRQIKVSNTSPDAALTVSDLKLPTGYTSNQTAFNLEIGTEKLLDITFKPESPGLKTGALQIISNAGNKSLALAALATINKAPIAVAPLVRIDHKIEERIELRGFDPDGDPIEFVVIDGPSLGTLTATSEAGFYSFVPSALPPEERHQDQIKFKVVEKDGGLSSNEAILKFGFNIADQKHVLKALSVSEPSNDQMTFTLNFEDKVLNNNYKLKVQYFDLTNRTNFILLDAIKPKSGMAINGDQAVLTFEANKTEHPLLFGTSKVPMLITLSSANGNSATEVYFLEGQPGNRVIPKANDSGSDDGNHLVFAGLTSVPENETREVKLFAIELGDFSLANSTIAITKNPLYGTITSPVQVDLKTNLASWSVNYSSTREVGSLDSLEFTVTNPARNTVLTAYAKIEVIEVPDAPALALLSNAEINEDENLSIDIKATDPDSELEFSAVSSDGTNVPVSLANGKLQVAPIKDFNGVVNISVSVTEKGGTSPQSDFDDFQLTIVPVNDAPVVSTIQDITINEDGETTIALLATDIDASIPEFDFQGTVSSPTDASFTIVGNQMTIKPRADYFGELTFAIKADDRTGTSSSLSQPQSFKLNVLPVNDAPTVIKALNTQTLIEGFPTYSLDLSNFFTDKEKASKDLIYSITNLSNVTLSITGSVLNISSVVGNTGLQTAQVTVSDGELSVSQALNFITAASSADITVANALSDLTLNEDFGTATIDLAGVFAYAIDPSATFNYSLAGNQSLSATINNGKIELQSLANFNGSDQLFVTGLVNGKAKLISFKINISPVNDAPTLVNLISDVSVNEDATLSSVIQTNTFADVDNDALTYSASYNAAWLTFDPNTRTFSGAPNNDQVGEVEVTVTATDPSGAKAEDVFKIVVSNTNDAPTSISINTNSLNENVAVGTLVGSLTSTDVDLGDTNFSYALVADTGGDDNGQFSIVGNQLLTSGNFDFESKSSYSIRIRTIDGFEGSFTKAMTISVNNVNESPSDISIDNLQVAENSPVSSQVGVFASTDPDTGDTHSYALVAGEGDDNNALFEISGNKLLTRSELDYETKQNYSIRIKTLDGAGLGFEEVFIVTVVNDAEAILRLEGGESPEITNVGETSNISLVIHNDGDGVLNITSIVYPSGFSGQGSIAGIEPGASQSIDVTFTPTEAKIYAGDIVFTYNGGTSIKSVSAEAQLVTSIEEGFIVEEEVTVFPNPAMDEVTIDLTEYNYRAVDVMIITESGVNMYERTKIKTTKHTVNVSSFSQGVLIVLIKSEFGVVRKKLIISR